MCWQSWKINFKVLNIDYENTYQSSYPRVVWKNSLLRKCNEILIIYDYQKTCICIYSCISHENDSNSHFEKKMLILYYD